MYNTTAEYKKTVESNQQNFKISVEVLFSGETEGDGILIPSDDIFSADGDESAFGTQGFGVGSAAATLFTVQIHNPNEKYNKNSLSSAEIRPKATLYTPDGTVIDTVPLGVFYTRNINILGTDLTLKCSDRMDDADNVPYSARKTFRSVYEILSDISFLLKSPLATSPGELPILSLIIDDSVFSGYSCRQVLSCIATAVGSFAVFNYRGELELKWFKESNIELRGDWSEEGIVLNGNTFSTDGNPVKITGVSVISGEKTLASAGSQSEEENARILEITDNPIAEAYPSEIAQFIYERLKDTVYIPCVWKRIGGDPSLQVGDIMTAIDNRERYNPERYEEYKKYKLYLSQKNWSFDGGFSDSYEAKAMPKKDKNKGLTVSKLVSRITEKVTAQTKDEINENIDEREKSLLIFNETIAYSLGLYTTVVQDGEGGQRIYYHDKEKLEDSGVIYTFGEGGFAWTKDGWNGGEPLWQYGADKNGNAILNTIYAYSLTADVIKSGVFDGSLIRADSVQSSSISSHYKEEVTNEIKNAATEVEQAFSAADGELLSRISEAKSEVEGSIEKTETKLSELRQTVENLNIGFTEKTTGGINLIRNSSGLNGVSDDWEYTGVVTAEQSAETSSGSLFRLREGTLSQEITVIRDKTYTLSFKARRDTANRCYLLINNGVTDIFAFDKQEAGEWEEHSLTFTAAGSTVKLSAGTTGNSLLIADLMLVEGESKNYWTPAPNEVYTECVKIDRRGINIINGENSTQTVIDHREFAVKYKNETVLTVNKDRTSLRDTEIKGNLYISDKGKIAPLSDGPGFDVVVFD